MATETETNKVASAGTPGRARDESAGSSGAGSTSGSRRRSGKVSPVHGRRDMKFYEVSSPELSELSAYSGFMTLFIGLGSISLGFTWDIWFAIISGGIDAAQIPALRGLQSGALLGTVLFYVIATVLFFIRKNRAAEIKSQTKFD